MWLTIVIKCLKASIFLQVIFLLHYAPTNFSIRASYKICGILYSGRNLSGPIFVLKDWDQSVSTKKDYRSSVQGWNYTGSILVKQNCKMKFCSGTYFEGHCESWPQGIIKPSTNVNSVSCTCSRVCKCEDVFIPKNTETCGRAYIDNTCNTCDSKYVQLLYKERWWDFHPEYVDSVKAITLRKGCNLTIYSEENGKGDRSVVTSQLVENFQGRLGSFECICDDSLYVSPHQTNSFSPIIDFQGNGTDLLDLLFAKKTLSQHPGLVAAILSSQMGRSIKNVYVLFIGVSNRNWPSPFSGCIYTSTSIGECHISLNLPEMGISNAQLRLIYIPMLTDFDRIISDTQWLTTLDKYLATHEDLKDAIPNAVVINHNPMEDVSIEEKGSPLQRKLALVNSLRGRLLDEKYSNLIFLLKTDKVERNPEETLAKYEAAIEKYYNFPRPLFIVPRQVEVYDEPRVNGHWELPNGEFSLQNFYEKLLLLSEKGGDALGHEVFKAAFPLDDKEWTVVNSTEFAVVSGNITAPDAISEMNSEILCDRHQWSPISGLIWSNRSDMHSFGFVDRRGNPLYVCRGFVNGKIRVGSFTFEDGFCTIWYKKLLNLRETAEVLIIPGGGTYFVTDENGLGYRLQYEIVSSHQISGNISDHNVIPVSAGDSNPLNSNKFIAFASFAKDEEKDSVVDKIGTVCFNKPVHALFSGESRRLVAEVFKVLVCTKTRM